MPQKKILILTASPDDQNRLHTDHEIRAIQQELERSRNRDRFEIVLKLAVKADDLIHILEDEKPEIVHFCGHAQEEGLVLVNQSGEAKIVGAEALARLFERFKHRIECVLLNACYTDAQAQEINQHIQYVIGMKQQAEDTAAIRFATNFYAALIAGHSYKDAFDFGCIALDLLGVEDDLFPIFLARQQPILSRIPTNPPNSLHYNSVINTLKDGQVIPFLGPGINLCDGQPFHQSISDIELANYLAKDLSIADFYEELVGAPCPACLVSYTDLPNDCPVKKALIEGAAPPCPLANEQALAIAKLNLQCLAQYVKFTSNIENVYTRLHTLFQGRYYSTNKLHQFFANLPLEMQNRGYPMPYQVLVTTNYDDMLERAFKAVNQPFDLVFYVAEGEEERGRFQYHPYDQSICPIPKDTVLNPKHPLILKLYGALNNFVITEEHHINYLVYREIGQLLPKDLLQALWDHNILFMGYSPNETTLRLIVNRIWGDKALGQESWMIHQSKPGELDKTFWSRRNVALFDNNLEDYVTELSRKISALEHKKSLYECWGP